MEKKIRVNFWGNMEFYAELKCFLFGYKDMSAYIEALIIKDIQNPQDWVSHGLDLKYAKAHQDKKEKKVWTMLERGGRWEIIKDTGKQIIPTGYRKKDIDTINKCVVYLNFGVKSDLSDRTIKELEEIKKARK